MIYCTKHCIIIQCCGNTTKKIRGKLGGGGETSAGGGGGGGGISPPLYQSLVGVIITPRCAAKGLSDCSWTGIYQGGYDKVQMSCD